MSPRSLVLACVAVTALFMASVFATKHQAEVVEQRAVSQAKKVAKAQVDAQVDDKIEATVTDELDARLLQPIPTSTLPAAEAPVDRVDPSTTTTVPEPFDLTTTTTAEPFDLTTTTSIEVPTTVTIPDPLPSP